MPCGISIGHFGQKDSSCCAGEVYEAEALTSDCMATGFLGFLLTCPVAFLVIVVESGWPARGKSRG